MRVLQYVHLDVFTNQAFTGNQLAVFLDAAGVGVALPLARYLAGVAVAYL